MGSSNYYVENTVFVAVGKNLKENESILPWVVHKFAGKMKICILHVHQPASLVSFLGGRLNVSKFQQRAINALRDADIQKLHKVISQYVLQLSQMGVHADRMWIEMDSVEEGIVKMIVQHGIKWLVMGAAADKSYKKEMAELKSQKAKLVCEQAPSSCHIWFICRGNLIFTRKGPGVDISIETEQLNANVTTIGRKRVCLDNGNANASREKESIHSNIRNKDSEHAWVGGPSADGLYLDSDVSTDESESSPLSDLIGEAEYEDEKNVVFEDSEHENLDSMIDEHKSPPRLTFQERGSILRACSIDFHSQVGNQLVYSALRDISSSHNSLNTEKQIAAEGKSHISRSHSSFDTAFLEGKMEGKARLQAPREIYNRLEQAISDTENVKKLTFQESVKRWKAEEDAMDAKKKADDAEYKLAEEMKHRQELQEDYASQRLERKRFEEEHNKIRTELPIIQGECLDLENQVKESEISAKELEEKIITAVELLISFKEKRDQLELERDNAVQEMGSLKKLNERSIAAFSGPLFPVFPLIEIGEATCGFDPSKRIGDGTYGSIYQGVLGHMKVAIRMLPNDGTQGQLMFEHQVETLSRVRHPNIVTIIGTCPEARSVVYEYLERGSLEDHLACKGKIHSLEWQTRVRIATELCSALIFLHTNNPPIFHGNLKPSNILLDTNFVSKMGDLGIFHLFLQNQRKLSYPVSVYTDPEFISAGVISPGSDVYAFGMILLQLLTGTPGMVKNVRLALQRDTLESILDFTAGDWPINQVTSIARIALQCCERSQSNRPDLVTQVWNVLQPLRKLCSREKSFWQNRETRKLPSHFLCPIYQEVMKDPCTAADGYTYEGEAIKEWLKSGHTTSPMTNLTLPTCDLIPNHALQYAIQDWLQQL